MIPRPAAAPGAGPLCGIHLPGCGRPVRMWKNGPMPAEDQGRLSAASPRRTPDDTTEEARMSKRGRKRKDRRKNSANHGKRPNS